jgi:hypothetical protein
MKMHTKTERRVLILDELLSLADTHESVELMRYRRLAFSFLTFNTAISRLMVSIGVECERRLEELRQAAQRLGVVESSRISAMQQAKQHGGTTQHFCIDSGDMALDELNQAIADSEYSLRFYERLREASAVPELHSLLLGIVKQKRAELAVLEERLASWDDLSATRA